MLVIEAVNAQAWLLEVYRLLESGRGLQLVEPVVAHFLDNAVSDHDQARAGARAGEMLVNGERRNVDEIPALPFELLGFGIPVPGECIKAVEFEIPVQVVAGSLGDKHDLLPHVPVFAGAGPRLQELHVGLDAAFLRIQTIMHEMLDEPVCAPFERHVLCVDDVQAGFVALPEFRGCRNIVGAEAAGLRACPRHVAFFDRLAHVAVLSRSFCWSMTFSENRCPLFGIMLYRSVGGLKSSCPFGGSVGGYDTIF